MDRHHGDPDHPQNVTRRKAWPITFHTIEMAGRGPPSNAFQMRDNGLLMTDVRP
jgi:hypothetical protein